MSVEFDLDQSCHEARNRLSRSIGQLARQAKVRCLRQIYPNGRLAECSDFGELIEYIAPKDGLFTTERPAALSMWVLDSKE